MKTSKKLLSVLLAMLLVFSTSSIAFAGVLKTENYDKVDTLISKNGLANVVDSLLVNLNASKDNLIGPVLKIVFLTMNDAKLQDTIGAVVGKKDISDAQPDELSQVLVEWLDEMLPEWLGDTSSIEKYSGIAGILGVDIKDLKSLNGLLNALSSACNVLSDNLLAGDLKNLNGSALSARYDNNTSSSALAVVKSLFTFLYDNRGIFGTVIRGGIARDGGLSIGTIFNGVLGDSLSSVNTIIDNLPDFLKSFVYLLIDGNAAKGDLKTNPKGDWGKSAYASYSADQMLAAALIRLINKAEPTEIISKEACDNALKMSFYDLLGEYVKPLYENYGISAWLNTHVKGLIEDICVTHEITALYKPLAGIDFESAAFNNKLNTFFAKAKTEGVLAQINGLVCLVAEEILTPSAYAELGLVNTNGNADLNDNLEKICRMALPLMANDTVKNALGYDFSGFTAAKVKDMNLRQMAVAVLKLFFNDWFDSSEVYDEALVKNAFCLEQLAAYAVYFTTGLEGVKAFLTDADVTAGLTAQGAKVTDITAANATEFILDTGALIGLGALKTNASKLHFDLTATVNNYKDIVDAVSDWGLNFIKGIPAVVVKEMKANRMTTDEGVYDDAVNGGAFYKINVVLNELIDFSFFTNDKGDKAKTSFKFDIGLFITDTLLDNIYNFDIAGILNAFKKNDLQTNILAGKNVVKQVLGLVDRVVTSFFTHDCKATKTQSVNEETCTEKIYFSCSYCSDNGHYVGKATNTVEARDAHNLGQPIEIIDNGCAKYVTNIYECKICGERIAKEGARKGQTHTEVFDKTVAPTCTAKGYDQYKCTVCKATRKTNSKNTISHNYVNGKCTMCGAADPSTPKVILGDINGDGQIKAADARLCLRASVGLENYTKGSREYSACDVNGDGQLKAADARLILRYSVGLETSFPAQK